MNDVKAQYEAFPYPARDPNEERRRLVNGSPSHPLEMDHFLWNGARNWREPLKALVAGGGTGDALIQLAQVMTMAKRPYEITYVDLSSASRAIAEERARVRGLKGITFVTGSLLDAPEMGQFDYIDCCGVLHHLPRPQDGFDALGRALAPGGGLGFMVYAPFGRSGVYPLQDAFAALFDGMSPKDKLREARKVFKSLPKNHPFALNRNVVDHKQGDAGFFDLLLHSTDRTYRVREVAEALDQAGLQLAGFSQPSLYDPRDIVGDIGLPDDPIARMAIAEELRGTIKMHTGYAVAKGRDQTVADGTDPTLVPHLKGGSAPALAGEIAKRGRVNVKVEGEAISLKIDKAAAPLIAGITGRAPLSAIAGQAGLDPIAFRSLWAPVTAQLTRLGLLWYSRLLT
ncbi:class I SAM-dependent methyltransferase [Aliiroseovarius subalbicans]|uniref:class I SAM-dependent methyltransferase n=1 Tax=Aliiroseovarius subalbicans TaxID=2925840 RepID=UPI001F596484|nr:class I SAM-dependent methyltransferase [Aliiroseovarius subalbicans]MCI2398661.1 class I SAM-dependent methyltransferase [Aliiroseovarius subalbicans]